MDNIFIIDPSLSKMDLIDAIDERIMHIKSILSCLAATEDGNFSFCEDGVYDLITIVKKIVEEIEQLQLKLITGLNL